MQAVKSTITHVDCMLCLFEALTSVLAVLQKWPLPQRQQLVKFITGSDKLPLPGTEALSISPLESFDIGVKEEQLMGCLPQVTVYCTLALAPLGDNFFRPWLRALRFL